jgi:uncharacterized protein YndB with AHSA1/START domain
MKVTLIIVGVIVAIVVCVVVVGALLPVKHRAQAEATFDATPAQVFALITDISRFPAWRTNLRSAEQLPASPDGKPRFKETSGDGTISYVMEVADPPRQLVTRIDDKTLPFGGRWTFDVIPAGTRTTLRVTEDGEVYNPLFRFVSRFVMGHDRGLKEYLAAAQRQVVATRK